VQRKKRRKGEDDDNEGQLLAANKKRYLRQQDCIDAAVSTPVALGSLSVMEKSRSKNCRKIRRTMAGQRSPVTFTRGSGPVNLEGYGDTFMSGALPIQGATDTIRVRIGSDVVTTVASMQHSYVPSLISSDSMLFEQEANDAEQQKQPLVTFGVQSECREITKKPQYIGSQPARSDRSYSPERDRSAHHIIATRLNSIAREHVQSEADGPKAQSIKPSEATDPSYRLTRLVGGVEHPLQLVFGRSASPPIRYARSPAHNAGKTQCVHAPFDATGDKSGHAPRNVGEDHHPATRRHPDAPVINDKEPWAMYLDSDTSSSGQVCAGNGTGMSVPQPHISARNTKDACTNWPRHNTPDSLTHVNLTKVSTSLPAHRQRGRPVATARPSLRTVDVKEVNKDEALWQTFAAVGSDSQSAIETVLSHKLSENSTSRATKGYASTRLPTAAVTSVSSTPFPSTPFKSLSGQASRVSEDVQYAPCSASRSIPSAVPSSPVWGRIRSPGGEDEDVPVGAQGDETSPGRLGEHLDRASLQNHASNDSEVYIDTRASYRDLNSRISSAWDDVSRRAQASGSTVWQRGWPSSIRGSDDTGIDLVDVEGLT
jgi:hypothetical protein